ncbi:hypothetical protein J0X19_06830 [Hymenobacter sp. BT186]|uniref:DUF3575 domain-containing protein n=1 Tax=Hymenobacter telluris TaxID=2816474 RepID=A0A939J8E1_9BACT|nr:hypothetical protein [Hymenobacter telluris]MBO0357654.1 hypothetical protein [Hymenobacter telluris]MBW3373681.1 hypothetical protein [Hymenobacter norwichensis]
MRLRFLVAGALVTGSLTVGQAQVPTPPTRTYNAKFDLVPLLASGYQVSVEKVWGPAYRQALVVTPQFYRGHIQDITSNLTEGSNRVRGYGLAVQHRIYLNERTTPLEGFYFGYGPHYQHFELQFQGPSWEPEVAPSGLTYYEYRSRGQQETVDRYGAAAVLGGQFFLPDLPVFLDVSVGLGWRKSSSRSTIAGNRYASGMSDYGADGHYLPVGFRLGVAW